MHFGTICHSINCDHERETAEKCRKTPTEKTHTQRTEKKSRTDGVNNKRIKIDDNNFVNKYTQTHTDRITWLYTREQNRFNVAIVQIHGILIRLNVIALISIQSVLFAHNLNHTDTIHIEV